MKVKDTAGLPDKFVRNATAAAGDYTSGVEGAAADWQAGAGAAGDNYAAGVQASIADKRFEKGVQGAGGRYASRAGSLGAQRYPTGVAASKGDWQQGTQPYLDVLKSLSLPPRRPKGDQGNNARSQAVAMALRAKKLGK